MTTSTIPKQENLEQGHAESVSLPRLDTVLMKSKGSQTRPFGLPNTKVDPILMAAIAPVSILPARAMVAHSRTDARPLPAASVGAVPNAQVQDVLSGMIVTRDLTPSESLPELEAHLPPARLPEPPAPQNLTWVASSGTLLSDVVRNWGYQETPHWWVVWNTKADFTIGSPYSIKAPDFLSASAQLFAAARQENHYFTVVKHPNHVLVVSTPTE
ncbi:TcpQ domain-containing protein [Bordetella sp. FB-8]|uniref:TcpQ domain-containing protein n=1 Tax=Bordetella sp. FB-8 TaxID=1159870 RepID=UPI0018CB83CF|nr:TcpQ domain-containing protein [Bordetella sp. FB-8]